MQWNHCIGTNSCVEMKHCSEMNSQTSWLTDAKLTLTFEIECWLFSLENCRIWLENTRLVNVGDCNVQKSLLCDNSYKNNLVLQVCSRFKSIHYSLKSQCCVRTVLYFTGIFMLNGNNSLRSLYIIASSSQGWFTVKRMVGINISWFNKTDI